MTYSVVFLFGGAIGGATGTPNGIPQWNLQWNPQSKNGTPNHKKLEPPTTKNWNPQPIFFCFYSKLIYDIEKVVLTLFYLQNYFWIAMFSKISM